jgi:hypothetical protein
MEAPKSESMRPMRRDGVSMGANDNNKDLMMCARLDVCSFKGRSDNHAVAIADPSTAPAQACLKQGCLTRMGGLRVLFGNRSRLELR